MVRIKTFAEAYRFLVNSVPKTSAGAFKGNAGFIKSKKWMDALGNPQDLIPTIHIAGTSGKGTVATLISTILQTHGKRTVLITSPHAYDIRERIILSGKQISTSQFIQTINHLLPVYQKMKKAGLAPSYFEIMMAMGFIVSAKHKVDYCVVETGLGGKLDTSNTIRREDKVCVLTPIGYDHMHILGNTLTEIASQKVGIVHENQRVFSAPQSPEPLAAIKRGCKKMGASITIPNTAKVLQKYGIKNLSKLNEQLSGTHNLNSLALAIEATQYLAKRDGWSLKPNVIKRAIKAFTLPGRMEIIRSVARKEFIFDGAHNEQKLTALVGALKRRYGRQKVGFVFASSKDDPRSKLNIIKEMADTIILTRYHSKELDMLRPQPDLKPFANDKNIFFLPETKDVVSYIKASNIKNWVVTGSFFVLKEIKDALKTKRQKIYQRKNQ